MSDHDSPVTSGLLALLGVGVALGVLAGIGVVVVNNVRGGSGSSGDSAGATLFLPDPAPGVALGEQIQAPTVAAEGDTAAADDGVTGTTTAPASSGVVLQLSPTKVKVNERVAVQGTYAGGEGEIVQVQYLSGDTWKDFPVPGVAVVSGRFSTNIQMATAGTYSFRVVDVGDGVTSNVVKVTVG